MRNRTQAWRRPGPVVLAILGGLAVSLLLSAVALGPGRSLLAATVGAGTQSLRQKEGRATGAGMHAVGALFTTTGTGLGSHFCTASVVHSPHGDLVLTAAHCVTGVAPARMTFVPGYRGGKAPYGVWAVTRVIMDPGWISSADPEFDFAFLVVRSSRWGGVENITGGERLGIGQPAGRVVQVVGYPDGARTPVVCQNRARWFSPGQLEFDCSGYADGTSGSPLLAGVNPATGLGTVIGVIGGYEQGGYSADVSYAARFGARVAALYKIAVSKS
jgi:V8-like Glu-specific endopeptidase